MSHVLHSNLEIGSARNAITLIGGVEKFVRPVSLVGIICIVQGSYVLTRF